jgi:hypothetical protein
MSVVVKHPPSSRRTCLLLIAMLATASMIDDSWSPRYLICRGSKVPRNVIDFPHIFSMSIPFAFLFNAERLASRIKVYGTVFKAGLMTCKFR